MNIKKEYTAKQFQDLTGVTRQRLHQLRKGFTVQSQGKAVTYPPMFIEGVDYYQKGRAIIYTASAFDKWSGHAG